MDIERLPGWAQEIPDPFRSDERFWRSVFASADALLSLSVAIVAAAVVALTVGGGWLAVPFALPLMFVAIAARAGWGSSRTNRAAVAPDAEYSWRDAERHAVARVFRHVLLRNRLRYP
jgi:hypothetical protein